MTLVLPPCSSNVTVSSDTWPGAPSNSKVQTSRSGGTISRYTPRNANSAPSAPRLTKRHAPPGLTSIWSTVVVRRRGPHQRGIESGSVYALNTSARGASKVCSMTIVRSDTKVSLVGLPDLLLMVVSILGLQSW